MVAQALAFSLFLAIPASLAVALGVFSLAGSETSVSGLVDRIDGVIPAESVTLIRESLERATQAKGQGVLLIIVGFGVALWSTTSAASTLMEAIARANGGTDERSFVRRRLGALAIIGSLAFAVCLLTLLLVLGPVVERAVGNATGTRSVLDWLWWVVQWPILVFALLVALTVPLYDQAANGRARRRHVLPGAAVATFLWLVASAGFGLYVSSFGSYDASWGSLSAVAVTLVWLWLTSIAVLFGAELNAELERADESATPVTRETLRPAGDRPADGDPRAPSLPDHGEGTGGPPVAEPGREVRDREEQRSQLNETTVGRDDIT